MGPGSKKHSSTHEEGELLPSEARLSDAKKQGKEKAMELEKHRGGGGTEIEKEKPKKEEKKFAGPTPGRVYKGRGLTHRQYHSPPPPSTSASASSSTASAAHMSDRWHFSRDEPHDRYHSRSEYSHPRDSYHSSRDRYEGSPPRRDVRHTRDRWREEDDRYRGRESPGRESSQGRDGGKNSSKEGQEKERLRDQPAPLDSDRQPNTTDSVSS
jgi:hypothetical protein